MTLPNTSPVHERKALITPLPDKRYSLYLSRSCWSWARRGGIDDVKVDGCDVGETC